MHFATGTSKTMLCAGLNALAVCVYI